MSYIDFTVNELQPGDKVICIVGKHLKKGIVESIEGDVNWPSIKIKGIKINIKPYKCVKYEWKSQKLFEK